MFENRALQPDNERIVDRDIFLAFSPLITELLLEILTGELNKIRKEIGLAETSILLVKETYKQNLKTRISEIEDGDMYP